MFRSSAYIYGRNVFYWFNTDIVRIAHDEPKSLITEKEPESLRCDAMNPFHLTRSHAEASRFAVAYMILNFVASGYSYLSFLLFHVQFSIFLITFLSLRFHMLLSSYIPAMVLFQYHHPSLQASSRSGFGKIWRGGVKRVYAAVITCKVIKH